MSGIRLAVRASCFIPIMLGTHALNAQTCLVLSPVTINADGTASLDLSLYSSSAKAPATVQWTFQYSPSSISSLEVDDGPTLVSSGKATFCAGDGTAYRCLAMGANRKTIANGVIAKLTAVLAPGATTAVISITGSLGASLAGDPIRIFSKIGQTTSTKASSDCGPPAPPGGVVSRK